MWATSTKNNIPSFKDSNYEQSTKMVINWSNIQLIMNQGSHKTLEYLVNDLDQGTMLDEKNIL